MPNGDQGSGAGGSRLLYGIANGVKRGGCRTAFDVAVARTVDRSLGGVGLARPRLLVSGFWRSGTTWLQECFGVALGAKTVFEPLSPMEPLRRTALHRRYPGDTEDVCQATIPGPCPDDADFWRYLDRACRGRLATDYLMSCRRDVAESFRRGIVVKDVRMQANLAAFHRHYATPVVHVRRHPCAVAASLIAADWHWSFGKATLATLLPRLGTAVPPEELAGIVGRFDTDLPARIAAFWAVTERVAAAALGPHPWGIVVAYEAFAATPRLVLDQICDALGLRQVGTVDFSQPSASVSPEIFAAYGAAPSDRWRSQLSSRDADRICAVADAVFPQWREPEPRTRAAASETMSTACRS